MKLKKASFIMKIVILAVIVYAGISIATVQAQIDEAKDNNAALQSEVAAALQKNAELEYDLAHVGDDETIEEIARENGFVQPGEKIFYDVGN